MKNSVSDLNEYLFAQLDALTNDELSGDSLNNEIEKSKAIVGISKTIIDNNKIILDAVKLQTEYGACKDGINNLLLGNNNG